MKKDIAKELKKIYDNIPNNILKSKPFIPSEYYIKALEEFKRQIVNKDELK